jgi:hypothetical protein
MDRSKEKFGAARREKSRIKGAELIKQWSREQ